MPEPVRFDSVPPVADTSGRAKVVEDSLSVKEMVAVSLTRSAVVLMEIVIVGAIVSIEIVGDSRPARLALPAGSVKVLAVTEMAPGVVELTVGVKTAV